MGISAIQPDAIASAGMPQVLMNTTLTDTAVKEQR